MATSTKILNPDAITYEQLDRNLKIADPGGVPSGPDQIIDLRTLLGMSPGGITTLDNIINLINANSFGDTMMDQLYARAGDVSGTFELYAKGDFEIYDAPAVLGLSIQKYTNGKNTQMNGDWYIEITRPGRVFDRVTGSNILSRRPEEATNVGITDYTTAIKAPNLKISYISPSEDPNYDNLNKDSITSLEIIQKGGFQPEFAMRNWVVKAIGSGTGFKGRAILAKVNC